jgi:hypothetical protein
MLMLADADDAPGRMLHLLHVALDDVCIRMLFVGNDFWRYSITTDGLKQNADGSLDTIIPKDKPREP